MNDLFKKINLFLGLIALSMLFSSCLTLEQYFSFTEDGACIVTWKYSAPIYAAAAIDQFRQTETGLNSGMKSLPFWPSDKTAVEAYYAERKEVELRQYKTYQKDGRQWVEVIVLARKAVPAFANGGFPGARLSIDNNGHHLMSVSIENIQNKVSQLEENKLRMLLNGTRIKFCVTVPKKISETNGNRLNEKQTDWEWTTNPTGSQMNLLRNDMSTAFVKW